MDISGTWEISGGYNNCDGNTDATITYTYQTDHYEVVMDGLFEHNDCSVESRVSTFLFATSSKKITKQEYKILLEKYYGPSCSIDTFTSSIIQFTYIDPKDDNKKTYIFKKALLQKLKIYNYNKSNILEEFIVK